VYLAAWKLMLPDSLWVRASAIASATCSGVRCSRKEGTPDEEGGPPEVPVDEGGWTWCAAPAAVFCRPVALGLFLTAREALRLAPALSVLCTQIAVGMQKGEGPSGR
jgi:hypothetical protein